MGSVKKFNSIILKEDGLNAKNYEIMASKDGETYSLIHASDKIEYHRLCTFEPVEARYIKFYIINADSAVSIKEFEVYNEPVRKAEDFRVCGYYADGWTDIPLGKKDGVVTEEQKRAELIKLIDKYNYRNLTHVFMYCGFGFDEKGNVSLYYTDNNGKVYPQDVCEDALKFVLDTIRSVNPTIKLSVIMSSGSNNPVINSAMDQNLDNFLKSLVDFCNRIGFDGIDIDYEFPQSDYDYKTFDNFLIQLKKYMDINMWNKEQSLISCAFGTRDIHYSEQAVKSIDMVNCMTYDIFDQDGYHSSFWGGCAQAGTYLETEGFTKEQINIGIPFYGTRLDALMEQYMWCNVGNRSYYQNIYEVTDYIGKPCQVYFNSPSMARDKTAFAVLAGFGGIMTWHSTIDVDMKDDMSLWKAINESAKQFGGVDYVG